MGLEEIGAQGIRLASGDLLMMGGDLLIRSGGNRKDLVQGTRRSWLLLNDTLGGFRDITKVRTSHSERLVILMWPTGRRGCVCRR